MSLDTLPYSVFLLLAEFSTGGALFLYAVHLRGQVTPGFVRMSATLLVFGAVLALWVSLLLPRVSVVSGYALAQQFLVPIRVALVVLLGHQIAYAALLWKGRSQASLALGRSMCLVAVIALALVTGFIQGPTWSYAGTFLSLLLGGLALAGVVLSMSLGHWYLVTPRLPERPLNEMIGALLIILLAQVLLVVVSLLAPIRFAPRALPVPVIENPALWLRVSVGILFPLLLGYMAWQASRMRGMMSATGLLYLATGAVLAGAALACGLLFATGIPF